MNNTEVQYVSPLKKICMTIGELPSSYLETMSYYEMLVWFTEFLKNQVVPAVNNNAEAVQELQNYVENYFDNLDVQEEINNKLESMLQDGTLSSLIGSYIQPLINQQNAEISAFKNTVNNEIDLQNQNIEQIEQLITQLGNTTPLVVSSTDDMTDTTKIYVNTTDGKWYYYNGSAWTIGGTYQSTGIGENTVYKPMLEIKLGNNFKGSMSAVTGVVWNAGGYYKNDGTIGTDQNYAYSSKISVNPHEIYFYPNDGGANNLVCFFDSSNNFVSKIANTEYLNPFEIPEGVSSIGITNITRQDRPERPNTLYKLTNYFLNGQNKINYGDMDDAFQNSFIPTYEDITSDLTFTDGFWHIQYVDWLNESYTPTTTFEHTKLNVVAGEKYRISATITGNVSLYQFVGGTNSIAYPTSSTSGRVYVDGLEITIPDGVYQLNISGYKAASGITGIKVEKCDGYTFIGGTDNSSYEIEQLQKFNIEQQLKNDFKWSSSISSGKYATFTFDDSRADISDIETLFETKGVPCCYATIPSRLTALTNSGETVKEVLQRAVTNGGEVLSHWASPLTSESSASDYYNVYVGAKKTLESEGFNVNGIITAGGTNYNTQNFSLDTEIARNNYLYADLTATNNTSIDQYWNRRNFLDGGVAEIETLIDNYVSGTGTQPYSKWLNFASHGTADTSLADIGTMIDYCISNNVQIVTWKYMYDHFKSSELEKRIEQLEI